MMSGSLLRVGLIGAGANTEARHLPGLQALPGIELVAVANRTLSSAVRVAEKWGIGRAEEEWQAVATASDVDALCIGTWPSLHAEATVLGLASGKHVLCEARMAADLAGAQRMVLESAARPELVAQLVPAPLTLGFDVQAIEACRSGRLGSLRRVSVEQLNGSWLARTGAVPWRLCQRHSGVNQLALGIFYEILLRWSGAEAEVLSVGAHLRPAISGHPWEAADLAEAIHVQGRFPDLEEASLDIHLSSIHQGDPVNRILIEGTQGSLLWDGQAGSLQINSSSAPPQTFLPPAGDPWQVEADFVSSIRDKHPVRLTSFSDGLNYMRFTQAVFDKMRLLPPPAVV